MVENDLTRFAPEVEVLLKPEIKVIAYWDGKKPLSITFENLAFSHKCPLLGTTDFETLEITYTPKSKVMEHNSLVKYLRSFDGIKITIEDAIHLIHKTITEVIDPRSLRITSNRYEQWSTMSVTMDSEFKEEEE